MLRPLGKSASVVITRAHVYVGAGATLIPRITLRGDAAGEIPIPSTPRTPTRAQHMQSVEEALRLAPQRPPRARLRIRLLAVELPDELPAHYEVLADAAELLRVQTSPPAETPTRFSVFSARRVRLTEVFIPGPGTFGAAHSDSGVAYWHAQVALFSFSYSGATDTVSTTLSARHWHRAAAPSRVDPSLTFLPRGHIRCATPSRTFGISP